MFESPADKLRATAWISRVPKDSQIASQAVESRHICVPEFCYSPVATILKTSPGSAHADQRLDCFRPHKRARRRGQAGQLFGKQRLRLHYGTDTNRGWRNCDDLTRLLLVGRTGDFLALLGTISEGKCWRISSHESMLNQRLVIKSVTLMYRPIAKYLSRGLYYRQYSIL